MNMGEFTEFVCKGLKAELQPCSKTLYGYGGQELEVKGQFTSVASMGRVRVSS